MRINGFTLIELLAVIVVLAIIALIATPIVLNIINNAKTSSNKRSGELYIKAVENAIMKKQMNGTDTVTLNTTYTVQSDGSICIVEGDTCKSGTTITIDVDGILPDVGGIITINEKGVVTDYTLTISGTSIVKGTPSSDESSDTICTLISGTSKTKGAKYSCRVNDTKTFNFYITGMNSDNSINLIMDRNICSSGNAETKSDRCSTAWLSVEDSDETAEYSSEDGAIITNTHGPITALNYLKQATSTWTNIDYNYGELVDEGGKYSNISLSGYHARMPKFSDFYEGTINEFMSAYQNDSTIVCNSNNSYFYDNIDQSEGICVIKFKNILSDEAGETSHYWLSSSFESNDAFFIGMSGLGASSVTTGDLVANPNLGDDMGVRPVITISKNQLN